MKIELGINGRGVGQAFRSHNLSVGVAGQARNGKDTFCDSMIRHLNYMDGGNKWKKTAFAELVKRMYCSVFGTTMEFVEEWKVKPEPPPGFKKNVRESLMLIGDDFRQIKEMAWVDGMFNAPHNVAHCLAICDVRYINEVNSIRLRGGVNVLVWRKGYENHTDHPSEKQLRPFVDMILEGKLNEGPERSDLTPFDYIMFNENGMSELEQKVISDFIPFLRSNANYPLPSCEAV